MYAPAPEMTADQVLQAFHHDGPSLFFGAMIMAVGLVAVAFSAIRRKHDPILIYFAFFAGLYGLRMWVKTDLLSLTIHGSWFYPRLRSAIDFIVPIPAFFYFKAAGLLRRQATVVGYDGLVVTNYHVIQGASHLTARTNEGAVFQFQRVLAHPQDVALAILKFAADGAAYLKLGQSTDAVEKQRALVIGSHEGLEETVSEGSISAFRPNRSMIQITAPISPESSGSPGNKRIGSGDWCCNNGD